MAAFPRAGNEQVNVFEVDETFLDFRIKTSGGQHTRSIVRSIESAGYDVACLG